MKKINVSNWENFYISEIFFTEKNGKNIQVPTGAMISKKMLEDGETPRVTVSNFNNGITGYYSDINDKNYRTYENFISVSFLGTVFYQPNKTSLDMKVHCLKPIEHKLNLYTATFLVNVIRKAISNFAYQDQLSSTILPKLIIKLPNKNNEPDWDYMESYMKNIMQESEKNINELIKLKINRTKIDIKKWKYFQIGGDDGIFNTYTGGDLILYKTKIGNIPIISHSSENNGIQMKSEKIEDRRLFDCKRTISLADRGNFKAFVQDEDFYIGTRVKALELKKHIKTPPKYAMQFIATVIFI